MNEVEVTYPNGTVAIKDCNICVDKGEFVFVVGRSGSGKSTFIKTLLGEVKPSNGDIIVGGKKINKLRRGKLPYYRRKVGVVFQEFRLLNDRNVYENVALAQRVIGAPEGHMERKITKMLNLVGLEEKMNSFPGELSGGEQQRIVIARALLNDPKMILADEPTGNLDAETGKDIMTLLHKISLEKTAVVMATHNMKWPQIFEGRVLKFNEMEVNEISVAEAVTTKNEE